MPVTLEGEGDQGVSEALADDLRVFAGNEQERAVRVSEAVDREPRQPARRDAAILRAFQKARVANRSLGRPVPTKQESALSLTLENGSRIVSLPGSEATVCGFSAVRLLVVDEAARVDDDLYYAVRPMLAVSGGQLVLLSTLYGKRGFFWEAWSSEEPWERYRVPASECPRISPVFLSEERRVSGSWWVDQEYGCGFLDAATQAFAPEDVGRAFGEDVAAWPL